MILVGMVDSTPNWVIADKESLEAWVRRFLWHYEGVCLGDGPEQAPNEPERIILKNILVALGVSSQPNPIIESVELLDPETYFQGD